jgi:hypothetical protein
VQSLFEQALLHFGFQFIFAFFFNGSLLSLNLFLLFLAVWTLVLGDFILLLESVFAQRGNVEGVTRVRGTTIHYLLGEKTSNDT